MFHKEHVVIMKILKTVVWVKSSSYWILQSGRTPLHEAASWGSNEQVVETLIKAGAGVNATDEVSYYQSSLCTNSYSNNTIAINICTYVHSYMARISWRFFLNLALMTALSLMRES